MQVKEVASKHGISVQKILNLLQELGLQDKDVNSTLSDSEVASLETRLTATLRKSFGTEKKQVKVISGSVARVVPRRVTTTEKTTTTVESGSPTPHVRKTMVSLDNKSTETPSESTSSETDNSQASAARSLLRRRLMRESGVVRKPVVVEPEIPPTPVVEETPPVEVVAPAPVDLEKAEPVVAQEPTTVPVDEIIEVVEPVPEQEDQVVERVDSVEVPVAVPALDTKPSKDKTETTGKDKPLLKPGTEPPKTKRPKTKRDKQSEIKEQKEERASQVSERKVLAAFSGLKKGKKQQYKRTKRERMAASQEAEREREHRETTTLRIHEATTVAEIAYGLNVPVGEVQKMLLDLGKIVTVNQYLDRESIDFIAGEYNFKVEEVSLLDINPFEELEEEDNPEDLVPRPPVVTVMGHVDHGKTKLMDAIRSADVASHEAGGITQHIGAYYVQTPQGAITFLDTPGHEAFTAMRARGAMVTDVVVLVVAANDGVMPQTREAIAHARAANVPIIVAINKIDVPGANVDRVKQQLSEEGLIPDEWGGQTPVAQISALKKIGIEQLVELIHIQAELLELKANPKRLASATIIEARLEQGRGVVATALIQNGTLKIGDSIVAGVYSGKVRALFNEHGKKVKEATPGIPVAILGLSGAPVAGDELHSVPDERTARDLAAKLQQLARERERRKPGHVTLETLFSKIEEGSVKELNLIVKGDVQGSVEAVCEALERIESDKVKVRILHRGVGAVSESDVMLAAASEAIIMGFNVAIPADAQSLRAQEQVDIRTYNVIYDAIEDIKKAMQGLLEDETREVVLGHLDVAKIFRSTKTGLVIGGVVRDGKITRNSRVRIIRDGRIVFDGKLISLRRFKDEASEVPEGLECGVGIENFQDIRERDVIECYHTESVAPTL